MSVRVKGSLGLVPPNRGNTVNKEARTLNTPHTHTVYPHTFHKEQSSPLWFAAEQNPRILPEDKVTAC